MNVKSFGANSMHPFLRHWIYLGPACGPDSVGKVLQGKIHCLGCRLNLTLLGSVIVLSCFQTNNPLQLNCKLSTSIYFGSFMQLSCHHMGLILYDNKFLRAERVRQIKHFNEDRLTPGNLPGEFCNGTR